MNNSTRWFLIGLTSSLTILLLIGLLAVAPVLAQGPGGMMGGGMRGGAGFNGGQFGSGPGWMRGTPQGVPGTAPSGFGPGWMHRNWQQDGQSAPFWPGGMMGGLMYEHMDDFGPGMMSGGMMINSNSPFFTPAEPLTLTEATDILKAYLADLNDSNLKLDEVMIFDNQAYAEIVEQDSGIGAMEVLIDPTSKAVFPEIGPNMMWNLKYGMMSGFGGYGMMGGRFGFNNQPGYGATPDGSAEMPVTPAQAVETAQTYLDTYFSAANLTADEHADPFYGYYTLHVNRDGETAGMLSVNGYTGQVFPHTWHGKLLEMSGE